MAAPKLSKRYRKLVIARILQNDPNEAIREALQQAGCSVTLTDAALSYYRTRPDVREKQARQQAQDYARWIADGLRERERQVKHWAQRAEQAYARAMGERWPDHPEGEPAMPVKAREFHRAMQEFFRCSEELERLLGER